MPPALGKDVLAVARTMMANERTVLAYGRTALGLYGAGIGFLKFLDFPLVMLTGWGLIGAATLILGLGVRQYHRIRKVFHGVKSKDLEWLQRAID